MAVHPKWALARFFFAMIDHLQRDIETRLAASEPEVEVLLVEPAGDGLRIVIDHPQGVSLALCERVTHALGEVREHYALEDALLSAYKKQPGSAKYARVEIDRETADFRVIELIIPERLEAHLIVETIDEGTTIDPETGEMREPEDPEIDPAKFEQYRDQIDERDVTPGDFGRIAAQTAKQVILQRIREAERDMMFEEYRDRVGELITGIVQQSDSRYTLVQLRERVEALLPKSEQVDGERYSLEVSSPGSERPLTKPAHFRRFVGRRARVRMRDLGGASRRSYTGELVGASEREVTLAAADGVIAIPYAEIRRCNLVEE